MTLDTLIAPPADPTAPKAWTHSRALLINGALTLVFALGLVGQLAGVFQIDPKWVALAGAAAAVINFFLRLDTKAPIAGTPAAAQAQTAKDALVMHAVEAVSLPAPAVVPSSDDLVQRLREFKLRHDADTAVLAQFAAVAAEPSVGATDVPPVAVTP